MIDSCQPHYELMNILLANITSNNAVHSKISTTARVSLLITITSDKWVSEVDSSEGQTVIEWKLMIDKW